MKPRIYDCFIFYNESRLLKLRLETLWEEVDLFVICESKYTFSGNPKPINFKMEDFKDFESKIRYLLIDHYPFETDDPWRREEYKRNYLMQGFHSNILNLKQGNSWHSWHLVSKQDFSQLN